MKRFALIFTLIVSLFGSAVAMAQQPADPLTVLADRFMFTVDKADLNRLSVLQLPAGDIFDMAPFGEPASTQIAFGRPPRPDFYPESFLTIRLYNIADFEPYTGHQPVLEQLITMLETRPDLKALELSDNIGANLLPTLPVFTHGQVLRARAEYVDTEHISGIRYIAAYKADLSPFDSRSFVYQFVGLTRDGQTVIGATGFIETALFPEEYESVDLEALAATLPQYIAESTALLNAAQPADFSPSLDTLDAIITSMTPQ